MITSVNFQTDNDGHEDFCSFFYSEWRYIDITMCKIFYFSNFNFSISFAYQTKFKQVMKYARNCDSSDQVIKLINSSIELRDNCDIFSSSCSQIKAYKKAVVNKLWQHHLFLLLPIYQGGDDSFQRKSTNIQKSIRLV